MAGRVIRIPNADSAQVRGGVLRDIPVQRGVGTPEELQHEIEHYMDVLLGRIPPPSDFGDLTLMEVADAYYARGMELTARIQAMESNGESFRGSAHYKFRTGPLRSFTDLARRAAELGSRRLTQARMLYDMERDSGV